MDEADAGYSGEHDVGCGGEGEGCFGSEIENVAPEALHSIRREKKIPRPGDGMGVVDFRAIVLSHDGDPLEALGHACRAELEVISEARRNKTWFAGEAASG